MAKLATVTRREPSSDPNIGTNYTQPSQERNKGMPIAIVRGCPHNRCKFCGFYKMPDGSNRLRFVIRPLVEVKKDVIAGKEIAKQIRGINSHDGRIRSVFLGDGDALAVSAHYLIELLEFTRERLPDLQTVKAYARVNAILNKGGCTLKRLQERGLTDVYVGFESGVDEILAANEKGVTVSDNLRAARMVAASGIKLHAMVIAGLGGAERSTEHAGRTAEMLNAMELETIMVSRFYPPYPLDAYPKVLGTRTPFTFLSEEAQVLEEIAIMRRLATDMPIFLGGFACCLEAIRAETRAEMIEKLEIILARVRNGEHLIHIAGNAGPN